MYVLYFIETTGYVITSHSKEQNWSDTKYKNAGM